MYSFDTGLQIFFSLPGRLLDHNFEIYDTDPRNKSTVKDLDEMKCWHLPLSYAKVEERVPEHALSSS